MGFLKPFLPLSSATVLKKCMEDDLFDQFLMEQLIYIYRNSDLDVFQLGAHEQINQIICAFDVIYERYSGKETANLPHHIEHIIINLVHFSISLWFSLEWQVCDLFKRCHLLQTLFRMESVFSKIPHLKTINWLYLRDLGLQPWADPYFKGHLSKDSSIDETMSATTAVRSEEDIRERANEDDIAILRQEGLVISLLRLIKMFDAGSMEAVKSFSMRLISAWNLLEQRDGFDDVLPEAKRCLNMICHIYMMAVYEKDNSTGYDIDNMINDVRFYHKTILDVQQNGKPIDDDFHDIIKTPAALIALTSVKMKQSFQDLAESVINDLVRETCNTRFGAVSHSYITYLLANILVDLNKQNVEDFDANIETYKRLLHVYVSEREKSERFALEEGRKRKLLSTSCNITTNVKGIYNYKAAIGKGNRRSNLVNEKSNSAYLFDIENEKRYDPVFQTMPYNETVTNEFYKILSKSNYKGWQYARLVLLLKIVDRELKEINNWCYHPGLPTEFMLGLESTLSRRFIDLAQIFERHIFMEQEFWLTAFYFRPDEYLYNKVLFCGTRYFRTINYLHRGCLNETIVKSADKTGAADGIITGDGEDGTSCAFMNAKYGLLSSTYDVKQIANMTGKSTAENDYGDLSKALRNLRLPENIIKDILTVTFSGRNANYTWAADWTTLRKRCKALLHSPELKRKLVESNMAEANDRLKYLKVDYKKYQNLPQLDYGTIEEGYEGAYTSEVRKDDDDDDMDDYDDDDEEDYDNIKKRKVVVGRQTKNSTKDLIDVEPERTETVSAEQIEQSEIIDGGSSNKRSSARRAAAVIASAMLREDFYQKASSKKKEEVKKTSIIEFDISSSSVDNGSNNQDQAAPLQPLPTLSPSPVAAEDIRNKIICNKYIKTSDYWVKEAKDSVQADKNLELFNTSCTFLARLKPVLSKKPTKSISSYQTSKNLTGPKRILSDSMSTSGRDGARNSVDRSDSENSFDTYEEAKKNERVCSKEKEIEVGGVITSKIMPLHSRSESANESNEIQDESINNQQYQLENQTSSFPNHEKEKPVSTSVEDNSGLESKIIENSTKNVLINEQETESTVLVTPQMPHVPLSVVDQQRSASETIDSFSTNQAAVAPTENPTDQTKNDVIETEDDITGTSPAKQIDSITNENAAILSVKVFQPTAPTEQCSINAQASDLTDSVMLAITSTTPSKATTNRKVSSSNDFADYDDIINSSVVRIEAKTAASVDTQKTPQKIKTATKSTRTKQNDDQNEYLTQMNTKSVEEKLQLETKSAAQVPTLADSVNHDQLADDSGQELPTHGNIVSSVATTSKENCVGDIKVEPTEPSSETLKAHVGADDGSSQSSSSGDNTKLSLETKKKLKQQMIENQFKRNCYVKLQRTCMKNYERQRLPTVRLKRINMQKYIKESSRSRSASKSKSFDSEENSSSPAPVPATRSSRKRRQSSTTPEESASPSSEEEYVPRKTRKRSTPTSVSSPASSTSATSTKKIKSEKASSSSLFKNLQQKNKQRNSGRNFSVVPRSASGMKVCISSSSLRDVTPPNECIEILSSDEDVQDPLPCPIQFANVSVPLADLAQFEVEEM